MTSVSEIKESFHKIDLNGDGRLSRRELMKAAAILGMNPTDKDIDTMMKDVDANSKLLFLMNSLFQTYVALSI